MEKDNCPSCCLNVLKQVKQDFKMVHPGRRGGLRILGGEDVFDAPHKFKGSDLVLMARISLRSGKQ